MKFIVAEKKMKVPPYIHQYAEKKLSKLDRFFKDDATASLTFSVEGRMNVVEVTVRSGGTILRVSEAFPDMRVSIDAAVSSIERQIRKNKTRLEKRLRQGAFEPVAEAEEVFSLVPDTEEEEYHIARTKTFSLKPMSREEAILQMNLLGHSFFAFRDDQTGGSFAVVYRRHQGDYGLITDET